MQDYVNKIIATALHNGLTLEQIASADPAKLAEAHLAAQIDAIDKAGEQLYREMTGKEMNAAK